MFHSLRMLRAQLMALELGDPTLRLVGDALIPPLRTAVARARALQQACDRVCRWHGIVRRVSGQFPTEPVVYVANHLGYVDPVTICSLTPCAPIAKVEVKSWPVIGTLAQRMNVIFVRRDDVGSAAAALRLAMQRLQAGVSVLNFPEGTTTRGEVLGFRRGIFGIATLLGVPVVPLALGFSEPDLCWVDDQAFLHHYSTALLGRTHTVNVRVGPMMFAQAGESADQFAARARRWIVTARAHGSAQSRVRARLSGRTAAPLSEAPAVLDESAA